MPVQGLSWSTELNPVLSPSCFPPPALLLPKMRCVVLRPCPMQNQEPRGRGPAPSSLHFHASCAQVTSPDDLDIFLPSPFLHPTMVLTSEREV
jgi:hypothetical protein